MPNKLPGANSVGWFAAAGGSSELIHISRFAKGGIFATEEGGYGVVLQLKGIDPECLSTDKLAACSASILQAQRLIGNRVSLFQTFIKKRAHHIEGSRFATDSESDVVRDTESARNAFVAARIFFDVSVHWTLYIGPPKRSKASFEAISLKMLRELEACVSNIVEELAEFGPKRLDADAAFRFFAYLTRLEEPIHGLSSPHRVNEQLADVAVAWHDPGLVFNSRTTRERFVQPFSLAKRPGAATPGMLAGLLKVPAEFVVVMESQRKANSAVTKTIGAHEHYLSMVKHNPFVHLAHRKKQSLPKTAASAAADEAIELTGFGGIVVDLQRGKTYCSFSILGLVHAPSEEDLRESMSALHRVFGASEATLLEEWIGALSCYQALFPGAVSKGPFVKSLNVRRCWMREDYIANLSLWFAPERGAQRSETLEDESLCVLESRAGTPYYFDQFGSGPRGVIVTGEPRRGKTFFVNFQVDHEMKYGGYVFIYDIGGNYENVALKYGGTVVKVGLDGPHLALFDLPDTEENHNHTARQVMILLERGGAKLKPQDETSIRESVAAIYALEDESMRRLRYLVLSPELQPYLAKWIYNGAYARYFDNARDDLRLTRIISFDFEQLSEPDRKVLMEPLLFWMRLRVNDLIRKLGNLHLPKLEVYDEVHRLIQDEWVLSAIFNTMKTAGKKLGGIILATHDAQDLGIHAEVIRNACPDAVFLGGSFNREQYRALFAMNDTQLDLIPTLRRGEMLLLRRHHAKVLQLVVDEPTKWLYSSHPQDVRRRALAINEHGRENAFALLAASASSK